MFIHIILHILSKDICCCLVLLKGWLLLHFCWHSLRCNDISFPMGLHILLNRVQRRLMMSYRLNFRLSYYQFSAVYTVRYTNLLFYMRLPLTSMYILFFRLPRTLVLPARYTNRPLIRLYFRLQCISCSSVCREQNSQMFKHFIIYFFYLFSSSFRFVDFQLLFQIYLTTKNGLNISFKPFHILNLIPLHIQPWQVHSFRCHTELP